MLLMTVSVSGALLSLGVLLFTVQRAAQEKLRRDEAWRVGASMPAGGEDEWFRGELPANTTAPFEEESTPEVEEEREVAAGSG